jgi:hypothetical protein
MVVRQCESCGVIDGRHTFHDEDEAAVPSGWSCEQCGSTAFEVVVMVEEDPAEEPDDDYA